MWKYLPISDYFRPEMQNTTVAHMIGDENTSFIWNKESSLSTNKTTYSWEDVNRSDNFEVIVQVINKFGIPVIIFGGLLGNSLSFTVFVTSHLKLQSCSIYLAFLNVVDSLFLMCLFTQWLGWFGIFLFHMQGWCQLIIYCSYVSSFLSAWGVVCFTVERFIVVYHPLKKQVFCTRYKAIVTVVSISAMSLVFYLFSFFIHGTVYHPGYETHLCIAYPGYDRMLRALTAIDTVLTLVLPSVAIVILNTAIAKQIWTFMLKHHPENSTRMLETCPEPHLHDDKPKCKTTSSSDRSDQREPLPMITSRPQGLRKHALHRPTTHRLKYRTTRSLLIVSSVFVLLNLPAHCLRIHMIINYLLHTANQHTAYMQRWMNILQFISYLNYSANFLLYCACNYNFRTGLRRIFQRLKRKYQETKISFIRFLIIPKGTPERRHEPQDEEI